MPAFVLPHIPRKYNNEDTRTPLTTTSWPAKLNFILDQNLSFVSILLTRKVSTSLKEKMRPKMGTKEF
jgi:hypothetical protein